MKESDLYPPVRDWLLARGYEIHVEIFDADIVFMEGGNQLTVVELKACLSNELYVQCCKRAKWADYVFAAVGSEPRNVNMFTHAGFGILVVKNGKVREKRCARPQPWLWHKMHDYRVKKLTGRSPAQEHELAGLKACRELREQRLLRT
jgi:hypothetical protein